MFIEFFRDALNGSLYIVTTIISVILLCACIGYLAEKSQKKRKKALEYASVDNSSNVSDEKIEEIDIKQNQSVVESNEEIQLNVAMPQMSQEQAIPEVNINQSPTTAQTQTIVNQQPVAQQSVQQPVQQPAAQPAPIPEIVTSSNNSQVTNDNTK